VDGLTQWQGVRVYRLLIVDDGYGRGGRALGRAGGDV